MKRIILCLSLFAFFGSQAQQINPVPDYVFSNKMSVGRNAVTDTAAYFSIGPRYGAIRGMMPPMVTDTASMSATKRNGLLIFSIQKNKYLYWDSVGSKWAEMAGTAGSAITGSGVAGYMPEFTTSTNLDTTRLYHSAGRFAIGSTTTTNGVFNVIGGTTYLEGNLSFGAADRTISNISNNVLAFGTNNTERMRIGANGDVSIGTTNADPFARGDDRRIAMDASGISSSANVALSLNAGSSAGRGAQLYLGVGGTRHFEISSNSVEQGISAISNTYIKFLTNNTERMRLKADGELLIGTTTDAGAFALQVAGSIYNTTGYWTGSSGQLGIGVTSSSYPMEIIKDGNSVGIGNSIISIRGSGGDDQRLHFGYNGTNVSLIAAARTLAFTRYDLVADGWRESMRINNTGELLIGTTSDAGAYALQVAGSIYNTTGAVLAASSGNVGIGTASPSNILHVNGGSGLALIRVSEAGTLRGFLGGANGMISGYTNEFAIRGESGLILSGQGNAVNAYINSSAGELIIANGNTDAGDYKLQVAGNIYNTGNITTGAPVGGTATSWRLGEVATVSPTSPNRTIRVEIGSQVLYIHAKTTND